MRRRGSAMVFAVVLIASMTTIIVATMWLTTSLSRDERLFEDEVRRRYAFDAACEQAAQDYTAGTLPTLPVTRTVNVNGVTCAITIADNSSNMPHTLSISGTMTYHNRGSVDVKVVGMRKAPSPFYYALFIDNGANMLGTLTTGASGVNGDAYFRGSVVLGGVGTVINGDLESNGSISAGTSTVTGSTIPNAVAVTFPSVVSSNYSSVANQTVSKSSLNGANFSATSGAYYLIYCSSTGTSISGTFTGKGTIFVNGNATISGPITLANSSSRVAIIASGSLTFSSAGPHHAYFYSGGNVSLPATGITIAKGSLVAAGLNTLTAQMTITNDTAVWLDSAEGAKHRLPGFYP